MTDDLIKRADAIGAWDKLPKRGRTEFDQVLMTLPSIERGDVEMNEVKSPYMQHRLDGVDLISRADVVKEFIKLFGCIQDVSDIDEWADICQTTVNEIPSTKITTNTPTDSINRADAKQQISEWATIITKPTLLDKDATMVVLDTLPSVEAVSRVPKGICAVCGNKKVCEDAKRNLDMTMCSIFELDTHYDLSIEAVQGEWIDDDGNNVPLDKDGYPLRSCHCNQCHEWLVGSDEYYTKGNFCPNCGADMRGVKHEID